MVSKLVSQTNDFWVVSLILNKSSIPVALSQI